MEIALVLSIGMNGVLVAAIFLLYRKYADKSRKVEHYQRISLDNKASLTDLKAQQKQNTFEFKRLEDLSDGIDSAMLDDQNFQKTKEKIETAPGLDSFVFKNKSRRAEEVKTPTLENQDEE